MSASNRKKEEHVDLRLSERLLKDFDDIAIRHKRSRNAELLVAIENYVAMNGTKVQK